jgi:hypothetical protein
MQQRTILKVLAVAVALTPAAVFTQSAKPTSATYITAEEIATVHALPGVDRTVKVVDIGGAQLRRRQRPAQRPAAVVRAAGRVALVGRRQAAAVGAAAQRQVAQQPQHRSRAAWRRRRRRPEGHLG